MRLQPITSYTNNSNNKKNNVQSQQLKNDIAFGYDFIPLERAQNDIKTIVTGMLKNEGNQFLALKQIKTNLSEFSKRFTKGLDERVTSDINHFRLSYQIPDGVTKTTDLFPDLESGIFKIENASINNANENLEYNKGLNGAKWLFYDACHSKRIQFDVAGQSSNPFEHKIWSLKNDRGSYNPLAKQKLIVWGEEAENAFNEYDENKKLQIITKIFKPSDEDLNKIVNNFITAHREKAIKSYTERENAAAAGKVDAFKF